MDAEEIIARRVAPELRDRSLVHRRAPKPMMPFSLPGMAR